MKEELEKRIHKGLAGREFETGPAPDQDAAARPRVVKPELEKRIVRGPDGLEFEVEPLRDYFCEAPPTVMPKAYLKIVEDLFNWARAESIWILGFGTGCGAIEMRPLMTPRFDAYRFGIQWRPTPRQANLFVISGYLSVKTLKRAIRSYEQMQNPKYVVGLGSCTINGASPGGLLRLYAFTEAIRHR